MKGNEVHIHLFYPDNGSRPWDLYININGGKVPKKTSMEKQWMPLTVSKRVIHLGPGLREVCLSTI